MAYEGPYYVVGAHVNHRNSYEITRSGEGCVATTHDAVLARKIVDALNQQEREKNSSPIINPSEA